MFYNYYINVKTNKVQITQPHKNSTFWAYKISKTNKQTHIISFFFIFLHKSTTIDEMIAPTHVLTPTIMLIGLNFIFPHRQNFFFVCRIQSSVHYIVFGLNQACTLKHYHLYFPKAQIYIFFLKSIEDQNIYSSKTNIHNITIKLLLGNMFYFSIRIS